MVPYIPKPSGGAVSISPINTAAGAHIIIAHNATGMPFILVV